MIIQGYYESWQRHWCDPLSEVIDTRNIAGSRSGEFSIIKKLLESAEDDQWFGYFSWKFDIKTGGSFRRFIYESSRLQAKCDFVYVNAMVMGRALFKCPYFQGEWSGHSGMIKCAEKLGLLEDFEYYAMNHYVVGSRYFWDSFIDFHSELDYLIKNLDDDTKCLLHGSGNYSRNYSIPLITFIRERALNNVMKRSGLRGIEFKIPIGSFCRKYGAVLGPKTKAVYSMYARDLLSSASLESLGFDIENNMHLFTVLDDPAVIPPQIN